MRWIKPSGLKITTNDMDKTIEYCESLGWVDEKKSQEKPKRKSAPSSTVSMQTSEVKGIE